MLDTIKIIIKAFIMKNCLPNPTFKNNKASIGLIFDAATPKVAATKAKFEN